MDRTELLAGGGARIERGTTNRPWAAKDPALLRVAANIQDLFQPLGYRSHRLGNWLDSWYLDCHLDLK